MSNEDKASQEDADEDRCHVQRKALASSDCDCNAVGEIKRSST